MARRGRAGRRTTRWFTVSQNANAITAATPEAIVPITFTPQTVGSTVLRAVGNVAYHGTTVDTAHTYACGLIVAPSTMDAADMDPCVDVDLDWLWWSRRGGNAAAYDGVDSFVLDRQYFDVKGRRRLDEGESLFFCENMTGTGGNSYVHFRLLILNP